MVAARWRSRCDDCPWAFALRGFLPSNLCVALSLLRVNARERAFLKRGVCALWVSEYPYVPRWRLRHTLRRVKATTERGFVVAYLLVSYMPLGRCIEVYCALSAVSHQF